MERPTLDSNITLTDFNDFYWLKEELIAFCKEKELNTSGGKLEIAERIACFLQTGEKKAAVKKKSKPASTFDWNTEKLSLATFITDNYKNTENVRAFFSANIGQHFKFNTLFMDWMKQNIGKTLANAIEEWNRLNELKKSNVHQTEIAPQFEYNRYIRAFLADNPTLGTTDAIKYWKLKKAIRGTNEYEPSDLQLQDN